MIYDMYVRTYVMHARLNMTKRCSVAISTETINQHFAIYTNSMYNTFGAMLTYLRLLVCLFRYTDALNPFIYRALVNLCTYSCMHLKKNIAYIRNNK